MSKIHLKLAVILLALFLGACAHHRLTQPPKLIKKGAANYPISAQLAQIEGEVLLGLFVNKEGKVEESEILSSSGNSDMDSSSLQYAKTMEFRPAIINGEKKSSWTKVLLKFSLTTVYFEPEEWIKEINNRQWLVRREKDAVKRAELLHDLYIAYHGFLKFAEKQEQVNKVNQVIKNVITKELIHKWQPLFDYYPASFLLLEDFLARYPDSNLTEEIKYRYRSELQKTLDAIEKGFYLIQIPEDQKAKIVEQVRVRLTKLNKELNISNLN